MKNGEFARHGDPGGLADEFLPKDKAPTVLYAKTSDGRVGGMATVQIPLGDDHMEIGDFFDGETGEESAQSDDENLRIRKVLMAGVRALMVQGGVREARFSVSPKRGPALQKLADSPLPRGFSFEADDAAARSMIRSTAPWFPPQRIPMHMALMTREENAQIDSSDAAQCEALFVRPGELGLHGTPERVNYVMNRCFPAGVDKVEGRASGIDVSLRRMKGGKFVARLIGDMTCRLFPASEVMQEELIGGNNMINFLKRKIMAEGGTNVAELFERFERKEDVALACRDGRLEHILNGANERGGSHNGKGVVLTRVAGREPIHGYRCTFKHGEKAQFAKNAVLIDEDGYLVEDLWHRRGEPIGNFALDFRQNHNAMQGVDRMMKMLVDEVEWE